MQTQTRTKTQLASMFEPRPVRLAMPLPPARGAHVEGLGSWLVQWADQIGLPERYCDSRIISLRMDYLVTRTFPRASVGSLKLAAAWALLLCLLDDFVDLGEHKPDELARELGRFRELLAGEADHNNEADHLRRSCSHFHHLIRSWPASTMKRFHREIERLFTTWEYEVSRNPTVQTTELEAYILRRRISCGMHVAYSLFPIVANQAPPQASSQLATLEAWACDLIAWTNDLSTSTRERGITTENLVFVLEQCNQLEPRAAEAMAIEMHNKRIGNFVSLASRIRANRIDPAIVAYVEMLESSVRAHHNWAKLTGRYQNAAPPGGSDMTEEANFGIEACHL